MGARIRVELTVEQGGDVENVGWFRQDRATHGAPSKGRAACWDTVNRYLHGISLSGLDHAFLSSRSQLPIGHVCYLRVGEAIRRHVREEHGFDLNRWSDRE